MWWYALYYKRAITKTLISTVIAVILLCILLNIARPFFVYTVSSGYLEGTVTFNARLTRVHYETLIVFLTGMLFELRALGLMVRQIIKAVIERKNAPN
jgi:hypothetical protein